MSVGNPIILAARPKIGKTVAFYSMEMENSEIYERLLSKLVEIPMNTLIDRCFQDKKRPQATRNE